MFFIQAERNLPSLLHVPSVADCNILNVNLRETAYSHLPSIKKSENNLEAQKSSNFSTEDTELNVKPGQARVCVVSMMGDFPVSHTGGSKEKIRALPIVVEPMTSAD